MSTSTLPATLGEYLQEARTNNHNHSFWGKCVLTHAHINEESAPEAEFIIADDYYPTYESALKDGIPWGMKVCRSCFKQMDDPYVLVRRVKVSLDKREKCNGEKNGGPCSLSGRHYVLAHGKRRWFCAHHIELMLLAGFETFTITREGKVKCTTERLLNIRGLSLADFS